MGFAVFEVGRVSVLVSFSTVFKSVFDMIIGVDMLLSEIVEVPRLDIEVMKIVAVEKI